MHNCTMNDILAVVKMTDVAVISLPDYCQYLIILKDA